MPWPPLLFVTGSEGFLRRRFVTEVIEQVRSEGRAIDYADGKNPRSITNILDTGAFMATETLVLVSNPDQADLQVLENHNEEGDSTYILLCHLEGNPDGRTAFGKLVKKLNKLHRSFSSPAPWKADAAAVDFCVEEAKRFQKTMAKKTAQALVAVVGSNLGVLHFEIFKAATLADAQGKETIGIPQVKGAIAPIAEAEVFPAIRALENRDLKRAIRCLDRVKATSKADPTMKVCRILGATFFKWLAAVNLDNQGVAPKTAAGQIGVKSPWYYQTKILPPAQAWGEATLIRMIHAIALSERAILAGHAAPWVGLQARLISACQPLR